MGKCGGNRGSRGSENFINEDRLFAGSRNIGDIGGRGGRIRRNVFPRDIRQLLLLIAEDDDPRNEVTLVLDSGCEDYCVIHHAHPIAVFDNTVVLREDDCYRFVDICCICVVKVDCNVILQELMEVFSESNEE